MAERQGIVIEEVKSNYTSQTCPRCGSISKGNWKGYSYFRCKRCDYEADRDRVASLNIALRADPKVTIPKAYSGSQIPERGASQKSSRLKNLTTTGKLSSHHC